MLIVNGKYLGATARVQSFNHELNKVKISVIKELRGFKEEALLEIANTDEIFFTLRFAAELVGMRADVLLTMIGSISVALPK